MDKEIKQEFENLARMVQSGFDGVYKEFNNRFEQVDKRFEQVDSRFNYMNARLSNIENDIAEIKKHFVYRYEFEDLMARVKYLEQKLEVESGK